MGGSDPRQYVARLRQGNQTVPPLPGAMLGAFLPQYFKTTCEKPYRRLGRVAEAWSTVVPEDLASRTALRSLHRQVLTIVVDSAATRYALDRALAAGLEQELLKVARGGTIRRIKIEVDRALFDPRRA